jgi:hypothetical protein
VAVEVLAGSVVAHRRSWVGVLAVIWVSWRLTPASSMVVTKVCLSMSRASWAFGFPRSP